MTILSGFADVSIFQLMPVAAVALFASLVGGVSGYGTSALMPLVGAAPIVPVIAISALGLAMRAAEAAWIAQGFPGEQTALEKIANEAATAARSAPPK